MLSNDEDSNQLYWKHFPMDIVQIVYIQMEMT